MPSAPQSRTNKIGLTRDEKLSYRVTSKLYSVCNNSILALISFLFNYFNCIFFLEKSIFYITFLRTQVKVSQELWKKKFQIELIPLNAKLLPCGAAVGCVRSHESQNHTTNRFM